MFELAKSDLYLIKLNCKIKLNTRKFQVHWPTYGNIVLVENSKLVVAY